MLAHLALFIRNWFHSQTRSKIYRCDSDEAAMVAHDLVTSKVKQKSTMNELIDIYLNVQIFKCPDI